MKKPPFLGIATAVLLAAGYGLLLLTDPLGRNWASHLAPVLIVAGLASAFVLAWRPGKGNGESGNPKNGE